MLLSYTIVDFHLFYDWAVDIQIWALLTRSQCKVSDTQVTIKACGPLVKNQRFIIRGMGCVSVCKIIPFIARKESLEKLNIVELFIIYTVNFFGIYFLLKSTQHNMVHQSELQSWQFNILLYCCLLLELWNVCLSVDNVWLCTKFLPYVLVHFHFSNNQLPISEQEQLQKQLFCNKMTTIEAVKNQRRPPSHQKYPPSSMVEVGDLVYNFCDGGKFRARNCYLVVSTGGKCC